jgi:allantoate deiminase
MVGDKIMMSTVNKNRLKRRIDLISEIGMLPEGGWARLAYTHEDRQARELVKKMMGQAGLKVRVDAIGNIFGYRAGLNNQLPIVAAGSHIDTVPQGGRFDGVLGVMSAIEALEVINERNLITQHPMEVIVFANEEGVRFSEGLLGSRALIGNVSREALRGCKDEAGITLERAIQGFGLSGIPEEAKAKPNQYQAYLELHIEQGAVLENAGITIGIVKGIAGPLWLEVKIKGRADHAGATPMALRKDALVAAGRLILETQRAALDAGGSCVATVGSLSAKPNAANIVPGEVILTIDIRDVDIERRDRVEKHLREYIAYLAESQEYACYIKTLQKVEPRFTSQGIGEVIAHHCSQLDLPYLVMNSGAAHDCQVMSSITDVGLIFIPSEDGLSHCPEEYSRWEHVEQGANVLLHSLLTIAGNKKDC